MPNQHDCKLFFDLCDQKEICCKIEEQVGIALDPADLLAIIELLRKESIIPGVED